MNAYLVSHNGLGDNLFMIGSLRFLSQFYNKIFFVCKSKYFDNVSLFFIDNPKIKCVRVEENGEMNNVVNLLKPKYKNNDIFVCGCFKRWLKSKITNKKLLNYKIESNNYNLNYDTINSKNYNFINNFYKDIGLNLTVFYEYFNLPENKLSQYLFNLVKDYRIIFIQLKSSNNKKLNIKNLIDKYLYDDKTILICNDQNLYNINSENPIIKQKKEIAQNFICNKIIYYKDTILNANEIYIIDSCFIGIILPYLKTNRLKAETIRIIKRDLANKFIL